MKLLRTAGYVWNLPNTGLGILIGTLSLAKPQRSGVAIDYLMRGGIPLWICRRLGISAFTVGDCVLYAVDPTDALRIHEGRHIAQYRLLGPLFLPVYFALLAVYGYWNHPLERDARAYERLVLGRVGPSRIRSVPAPFHPRE